MALSTVSNSPSLALWISAVGCTALVFWLVIAMFIESARESAKLKHRKRVQESWRTVFLTLKAFGVQPSTMPTLPRADVLEMARYWIAHVNSVDGESREHLLQLGRSLNLADRLRKHLTAKNPGHQVLAVCVAGWLNDTAAYSTLKRILASTNPTLAFTAAMALLRMNATKNAAEVFQRMCRGDCGAGYVAKILRELRHLQTASEVLHLLHVLGPKQGGALLQSWAQVNYEAAVAYSRAVLANPENEGWLLCGALKVLKNPHDISLVRPYLEHGLWSVRVQAINAITRLGLRQDVENLAITQGVENWWLQERALDAFQDHPQISAADAAILSDRLLNSPSPLSK